MESCFTWARFLWKLAAETYIHLSLPFFFFFVSREEPTSEGEWIVMNEDVSCQLSSPLCSLPSWFEMLAYKHWWDG